MKKFVLPHDYPDMPSSLMHIYLIEAGPRLLAGMSPVWSEHAEQFLREMGVNILLNKRVVDYRDHKVMLEDGSEIATRTFIWVSGVTGVPVGYLDKSAVGRGGRIKVDEFKKVRMQGWFAWIVWLVVHLRSILGVRNQVVVLLNWIWNYLTYDQSMRMIVYAKKAKEVREREEKEATTHLGEDVLHTGK